MQAKIASNYSWSNQQSSTAGAQTIGWWMVPAAARVEKWEQHLIKWMPPFPVHERKKNRRDKNLTAQIVELYIQQRCHPSFFSVYDLVVR